MFLTRLAFVLVAYTTAIVVASYTFTSSILHSVQLVPVNLIDNVVVEGIDPDGVTNAHPAVPDPVALVYVRGVQVDPSELTSTVNSLFAAFVPFLRPKDYLTFEAVIVLVLIPEMMKFSPVAFTITLLLPEAPE